MSKIFTSKKEVMSTFFTFVLFFIFGAVTILFLRFIDNPDVLEQQTRDLCREYADRNHEKEFAPERYKAFKEMIDNYDYYTSCLNHSGIVVK